MKDFISIAVVAVIVLLVFLYFRGGTHQSNNLKIEFPVGWHVKVNQKANDSTVFKASSFILRSNFTMKSVNLKSFPGCAHDGKTSFLSVSSSGNKIYNNYFMEVEGVCYNLRFEASNKSRNADKFGESCQKIVDSFATY